ncbi:MULTISPECIES: addiction module protein [unclassified Spirulina]|uniref:addiction module protein n=1 Tax=unclassified Spirulina TaxID=2684457 RepID=UPI00194E6713|nr:MULTISPECIES: addiction module protein [Spirulina]MEA5470173.1 addiction module protein [Spirulina sp. 06S082]
MSDLTQKVFREALALSPIERAMLIDALVDSLDQSDPQIDQLWLEEAETRLQANREGKLETISASQVFEEMRNL